MLISDIFPLIEGLAALRGGARVEVFDNPSKQALLALVDFSKEKRVRGLILDDDVKWWDAYDATHSDMAMLYDPAHDSFDTLIEYKKHRLELRLEGRKLHLFTGSDASVIASHPHLSFLSNPRVQITTTFKNFN